jgi:hypothetical protein
MPTHATFASIELISHSTLTSSNEEIFERLNSRLQVGFISIGVRPSPNPNCLAILEDSLQTD